MARLQDAGIGTGLHFNAVHLHPYFREHSGTDPGDLPVTEAIAERIVSLPLFPDLTEADVFDVAAALKRVIRDDD